MTAPTSPTELPETLPHCALLELLPPDEACEFKKKCCKKYKRGKRCKKCPNG